MQLLSGKLVSEAVKVELSQQIEYLKVKNHRAPHLVAVLVGSNGASETYVASKIKNCAEIGFKSTLLRFDENVSEQELIQAIEKLNNNEDVDGILVQLPLPKQIRADRVIRAIDPAKDVDGFHPVNVGRLVQNRATFVACTPSGVIELLEREGVAIAGSHAVVIGRSDIVGKPMALLLIHANATGTVCHSKTRDLNEATRRAALVVAGVGWAGWGGGRRGRRGAALLDAGGQPGLCVGAGSRAW